MAKTLDNWASMFEKRVARSRAADAAHDLSHVRRVVANAIHIARRESARLDIVVPAAWLHDLVPVKKHSTERSSGSRRSAVAAERFLRKIRYPAALIPAIKHAIEAHSFSAGIRPATLEAKVIQDADRLDALGAVGLARCFLTSAQIPGQKLYYEAGPFVEDREPDDAKYALDHLMVKPLPSVRTMQTRTGSKEAKRRERIMREFLSQFKTELAFASEGL